jgi:hydroxymethylglutaryl-CoA lyase
MLSTVYPKCIHSLNKWLQECGKRRELYNRINPQLCDVTLRDGLQTVPKNMQHIWTTCEKKNTYYRLKFNHNPQNVEAGSLVNPKILPIFSDSLELYKSINEDLDQMPNYNTQNENIYLLVPNLRMLKKALENGVKNFSFITSVSNAFQKKNINKTLLETKNELKEMFKEVINNDDENNEKYKIKLYISCINDCPLTGQIDNDYIVREILLYEKEQKIGELCLSDTCGTMKFEDFEYIIDNCMYFGIPSNKLSLHLHCREDNMEHTKQIIHYALDKNINKFDVSMLDGGGCSVTMKKEKYAQNLSYEIFYRFLVNYIEKRMQLDK